MKEALINMVVWMTDKIKLLVQEGYRYMLQDVNIYNIVMAVMIVSFFVSFLVKKYYLQVASSISSAVEDYKERRMQGNLMMSCCGAKPDL